MELVNRPNPVVCLAQYNNRNQLEACLLQLQPRHSHKTICSERRTPIKEEGCLAQLQILHSRRITAFLAHQARPKAVDSLHLPLQPPSLSRTPAPSEEAFLGVKDRITNRLNPEGISEAFPFNKAVGSLETIACPRIQAYSDLRIHSKHSHSNKAVDCFDR